MIVFCQSQYPLNLCIKENKCYICIYEWLCAEEKERQRYITLYAVCSEIKVSSAQFKKKLILLWQSYFFSLPMIHSEIPQVNEFLNPPSPIDMLPVSCPLYGVALLLSRI